MRYLTVRDVVGRRVTEGALIAMRDAISTWEPLARILALQRANGSFSSNGNPLDARRTFWALLPMQRCGLDITDEPVARAVDHLAARHLSTGAVGVTAPYSGT